MTQSVRDQMTFGYTQSAYWFMVDFNYNGKSPKKFYLEIPRRQTDEIDFYTIVEGQNILHKKVGDFRPFFERLVQHRNFLPPITLHPAKTTRLVFRIKTSECGGCHRRKERNRDRKILQQFSGAYNNQMHMR